MVKSVEVAIIGGGIMGASIAYHLAKRGMKDIVIFEREEALGTGATGKCAGGVRLQFSTVANIEMSRLSIAALERFEEEMDEPVDFKRNGYLFVLTTEEDLEAFRANAERQREMGVPVEVLTPEAGARYRSPSSTSTISSARRFVTLTASQTHMRSCRGTRRMRGAWVLTSSSLRR